MTLYPAFMTRRRVGFKVKQAYTFTYKFLQKTEPRVLVRLFSVSSDSPYKFLWSSQFIKRTDTYGSGPGRGHCAQTGSRIFSASYPTHIGGPFPGHKISWS
jgi:hypothetical protein